MTGAKTITAFSSWRQPLILLSFAFLATLGLYWQTLYGMVEIWSRSETFTHGFLIAPISAYMVWRRRTDLLGYSPSPAYPALLAIIAISLVWFLADIMAVNALEQFAFVALFPALVWAILGGRIARALAFPLGYLFFSVPFGEFLTDPLMNYTAEFTVKALQLTGIPVYSAGRFISVPSGDWEVAQACSGVRYLIASVALGCLYAYLTYRSFWRRAGFMLLAVIVPIFANWLRAYGIIMLAHLSDRKLAVGVDHIIYGWVFFGFVMLLLFWIGSFWQEPDESATATPQVEPTAMDTDPIRRRTGTLYVMALAVALLALGPVGSLATAARQALIPVAAVVDLPDSHAGWQALGGATPDWSPNYVGADQNVFKTYTKANDEVWLYIALYNRQAQGRELINSQNRLYRQRRWSEVADRIRSVGFDGGTPLAVREIRFAWEEQKRLIWTWSDITGWVTTNAIEAKLLGAVADLLARPGGIAQIAIATDYEHGPDEAERRLTDFLRSFQDKLIPLERTQLPATPE